MRAHVRVKLRPIIFANANVPAQRQSSHSRALQRMLVAMGSTSDDSVICLEPNCVRLPTRSELNSCIAR
jgi:hypothetical protein